MNTTRSVRAGIAPSPWLITRNCRQIRCYSHLLFWRFLPGISHLSSHRLETLTTNGIGAFVDFSSARCTTSTGTAGCLPSSASQCLQPVLLAAALPGQIHSVVPYLQTNAVACLRFDGVKSWVVIVFPFLGYKVAGSISATLFG